MMIIALRDAEHQAAFYDKQIYARYFLSVFKGRKISSISGEEVINSLPDYNIERKQRLSNGTKNRYRAFIMRAFSMAMKMGWIKNVPHVSRLREPKVRVRWLEKGLARVLIDSLKIDWMKDIAAFALLTGMRKGEILSLTWDNVDLNRKVAIVTADKAKSGKARAIPLNDEAVDILSQQPRNCESVFSCNGERIKQINRADFKNALKRSGIVDFRFHDLRHTWASWHVQNGTPLMLLKEMGGWETLEMVNKYAHLSGEHLTKYSGIVTFLAHKDTSSTYQSNNKLASL
ncbi:site-specific integrase [Budviciaceae bacterium BWR-B9]|uniref:Site-specific integrase n=1 Tax=Limnobaculum allomyrinae TaxID=2791986 RepID=A0ABS1IUK2_9GAMM|nr:MULTISPECIES: site-specific integrase [Limnobaculum]MBK5145418.1 site-specific integrase [Limnobaculum allomyrinae]MBV7693154.1 site-specific integrase [Limnobaculum sp. M2-1]